MNKNNISNPFLTSYGTPFNAIPYDRITLEDYIPAVKEAIRMEKETIDAICSNNEPATFDNTIVALDRAGLLLGEIIGAFNAVANACSNDDILAVEEEMELLCTSHHNDVSLNSQLFTRIKEVYNSDTSTLDIAQKRLLEQTYTSFIRNGANLAGECRNEYRKLTERLSVLSIKFQENNIKDTDAFTLHVTNESDTEGLPEDVKEAAANNAKENGKEGWLFTLHRPSYLHYQTM